MNKSIKPAITAIAIAFTTLSCTGSTYGQSVAADTAATKAVPVATAPVPHGYLVASYTIKDQSAYQNYRTAEAAIAAKSGGQVIIYDANTTVLEKSPKKVIDIIEFPSAEAAEQFYNSAEYAAAKKSRIKSTEGWVLLAISPPTARKQPDSTISQTVQPNGYLVVNYTIHDQATFQKYMDAAGSLAPKFNGSVPIFDLNTKTLEGNPQKIFGIAAFPSVADAKRFYNSPEYTAARKFRIAATEGTNQLAASVPPQQ